MTNKKLIVKNRIFFKSFKSSHNKILDPETFLTNHFKKIKKLIVSYLLTHNVVKFQLTLSLELQKEMPFEETRICNPFFLAK